MGETLFYDILTHLGGGLGLELQKIKIYYRSLYVPTFIYVSIFRIRDPEVIRARGVDAGCGRGFRVKTRIGCDAGRAAGADRQMRGVEPDGPGAAGAVANEGRGHHPLEWQPPLGSNKSE